MNLFTKLALLVLAAVVLSIGFLKGRDILTVRNAAHEAAISMDMLASLPAADYTPFGQLASNNDFNIRDLSDAEHGDFRGLAVIGPEKHVVLTFFNPANIRAERDWTSIVLDRNLKHILITKTQSALRVFKSYILRREGYYTFLLDANPGLVAFERYAPNTPVTSGLIRTLYEKSSYYRYDEYAIRNENHSRIGIIKAHVFYIEGKWIEVRAETDLDEKFPAKGQDDLSTSQSSRVLKVIAPSYDDEDNSALLNGGKASITLDHFLKETYFKARGPVMGAPTGNSRAAAWSGQAYYTLQFGAKALKFIWPHVLRSRTLLYSDPAMDYVLVARRVGRQYVLISPTQGRR